jgi:hypothetical protein
LYVALIGCSLFEGGAEGAQKEKKPLHKPQRQMLEETKTE